MSVPGLGRAVPLILIHPEDISERWDGDRIRGRFNVFMKLVAQHVDLSKQEMSVDKLNNTFKMMDQGSDSETQVPENGPVVKEPVGGWFQSCGRCCDTNHTADCPTLEPATSRGIKVTAIQTQEPSDPRRRGTDTHHVWRYSEVF